MPKVSFTSHENSEEADEKERTNVRRQSRTSPVFLVEEEDFARRLSTSINVERRLSTVSQLYLPHGVEYHSQQRVPPAGPEFDQPFLLNQIEDSDGNLNQRRLSILSQVSLPIEEENLERRRRILFIVEPLIIGLILFPMLVPFCECGWNLVFLTLIVVPRYLFPPHPEGIRKEFDD